MRECHSVHADRRTLKPPAAPMTRTVGLPHPISPVTIKRTAIERKESAPE
jgi:hypothetical protein